MADFSNYMSPGRKGYLIGIGGVSMSSLAEVLLGMGINVCGSDSNRSGNVRSLEAKGIHIEIGHRAENIPADIDFVVRTAAVRDENPEIRRARELNIPVFDLGRHLQGLQECRLHFRNARKNHDHLDVHTHPDGCRQGPNGHDRGHAAPFKRGAPRRTRERDCDGGL